MFLVILTISVGLVGWFGMKRTSEAYSEMAYNVRATDIKRLTNELEDILQNVPQDVTFFSNFYALKRFFIWSEMKEHYKAEKWKQIYSDALLDALSTQQKYYKSRVITLSGQELINAQYDKEKEYAFLHSSEELQNKSGRGYVEEPKKLKKGEFYISDMNLNLEYGKISKPFTPVIRYATPIIDANGKRTAIFVVSVYADVLLKRIEAAIKREKGKGVAYYLVDKDGNYLFNEDKAKMWGKQLKNGFNFNREFFSIAEMFRDTDSGAFEREGKIYSFSKVYPLKENRDNYWYLVSSVDTSVALAKVDSFKTVFILMLLFVAIMSFFVVRAFVKKITDPLSQVTKQLQALSQGEIKQMYIAYDAKDEVGAIVASSQRLVDAIDTTIQQAHAVADGNFTREIKLLSQKDALGLAIRSMTARLKEITALAESLSVGNYDVQVFSKNSEDKLGLALVNMVAYLKNITDIAESISLGNLNVKYKAKGKDDRLGYAILQMIKYLRTILKHAEAISNEDFTVSIKIKSKDDELGFALDRMTTMLRDSSIKTKNEIYISEGVGELSDAITGVRDSVELAEEAISRVCHYINAGSGVVYTFDKEKKELTLIASFAHSTRAGFSEAFTLGEGVVGQVALEREAILLQNINDATYLIESATVTAMAKEVFVFPLIHEGELLGVVELLSFESFSDIQREYLAKISSLFATALYTVNQNMQIKILLEKSQEAFEELQTQSEELQETNVQMEEQQQQLKLQSRELQLKNETLAEAKKVLDKRAEELEKAYRYKSEFLANMSHELRTPLNSIILLSKLLTQNPSKHLDAKEVEKAAVIHKAGNDLLLLINDILDLSKIESGKMDFFYESVDSTSFLEDIKGLFSPIAEEKGLKFEVEDRFQKAFQTDKQKLSQVLKNLLSNAFKFTKSGYVKLGMYAADDRVKIYVEDSGIGIPKESIESIFEAFKQVDGSISREFGGTGLGLSISKTIVELMSGEISVESRVGEGTRFCVILPLKGTQESSGQKEKHKEQEASPLDISLAERKEEQIAPMKILEDTSVDTVDADELRGKNILIVDDDSRNIFTLTSTLESMGAEVFSAFNGKEAIELLEETPQIDLILMDVMMPVMDGLKAMESIKADARFKKIPIIAITAKSMPEDKQLCLDHGADDYLTKPLQQSALISMIKAWV